MTAEPDSPSDVSAIGTSARSECQGRVRARPQPRPMTTITPLPVPSYKHATCAWCRNEFPTITALLAHVDDGHLDTTEVTAAGRPPKAA